jgi:hypothetical protein
VRLHRVNTHRGTTEREHREHEGLSHTNPKAFHCGISLLRVACGLHNAAEPEANLAMAENFLLCSRQVRVAISCDTCFREAVMRVLLIEDEPWLGQAVRDQIERTGIRPTSWPISPMRRHLAATYDLILLDLLLPDGRGLDFLRELRASGSNVPSSS